MRFLFALTLILAISVSAKVGLSGDKTAPTAEDVEQLLRNSLAGNGEHIASIAHLKEAELLAFRLDGVKSVGLSKWQGDATLTFEFEPPPAGVVGFERRRHGPYYLYIEKHGNRWHLIRFGAAGALEPDPKVVE